MPTDGPVIVRDKEVCGGRPIFRGTRVFAETLFENLADGMSLDEIMKNGRLSIEATSSAFCWKPLQ